MNFSSDYTDHHLLTWGFYFDYNNDDDDFPLNYRFYFDYYNDDDLTPAFQLLIIMIIFSFVFFFLS